MITIAISGHRRSLRKIVHGAALLAWTIGAIALLVATLDGPPTPPVGCFAIWCFLGAAIAWNSARRGAGRETLTVTSRQLVLRRAVGPFRLRRRYDLRRVRRPRLAAPARRRFRIEFEYDGRTRRFGQNLTAPEASCIVSMIRRASTPFLS